MPCGVVRVAARNYVLPLCVCTDLRAADRGGTSDPYAVVSVGAAFGNRKTCAISKCLNPTWNAEFMFAGASIDDVEMLHVEIYDKVIHIYE